MKLRFLWVGRTREADLASAIERYLERIRRYAAVTVETVPDAGRSAGRRPADVARAEGRHLIRMLAPRGRHLGLHPAGARVDSPGLARLLERSFTAGGGRVQLVLGGPAGLAPQVLDRMDELVSLTPLTLTHEMSRLLLVEQIYRAFSILEGEPYHR